MSFIPALAWLILKLKTNTSQPTVARHSNETLNRCSDIRVKNCQKFDRKTKTDSPPNLNKMVNKRSTKSVNKSLNNTPKSNTETLRDENQIHHIIKIKKHIIDYSF